MRLISQDRTIDAPYDTASVRITRTGKREYRIYALTTEAQLVMGDYNSNSHTLAVMKQMLDAYKSEANVFFFPDNDDIVTKEDCT